MIDKNLSFYQPGTYKNWTNNVTKLDEKIKEFVVFHCVENESLKL